MEVEEDVNQDESGQDNIADPTIATKYRMAGDIANSAFARAPPPPPSPPARACVCVCARARACVCVVVCAAFGVCVTWSSHVHCVVPVPAVVA